VTDLLAEAATWPLPPRRAIRAIADTLQQLDEALRAVDKSAYPGVPERAWGVVAARTRQLLSGVPATFPGIPRRSRAEQAANQPREPKGKPGGGRFAATP
jgi:hypothetical protein